MRLGDCRCGCPLAEVEAWHVSALAVSGSGTLGVLQVFRPDLTTVLDVSAAAERLLRSALAISRDV